MKIENQTNLDALLLISMGNTGIPTDDAGIDESEMSSDPVVVESAGGEGEQ